MRVKSIVGVALLVFLIIFIIGAFGGCSIKKLSIVGGDVIRYSLCLGDNQTQIVTCPLISNKKIDKIELVSIQLSNGTSIHAKLNKFEKDTYEKYKGNYIYFAILELSCSDAENIVNTDVKNVVFKVDGNYVDYKTPYFKVCNIAALLDGEKYEKDRGTLLISGDLTGLYGSIPDEKHKTQLILTADKDITYESYDILDYIKIQELTVSNESVDAANINIEAKKGEDTIFNYYLKHEDNVGDSNIIRCSQIIKYKCNNENRVWVYTPGIYIWKNFEEYGAIKLYIDQLK